MKRIAFLTVCSSVEPTSAFIGIEKNKKWNQHSGQTLICKFAVGQTAKNYQFFLGRYKIMLKQYLQQTLLQRLSPQQIQLMKLLEVPTIALEQRIKEELELNPALEEGNDEQENSDEDNILNEDLGEPEETEIDNLDISYYTDDGEIAPYKLQINNTNPDEERKDLPFVSGISFYDALESQLNLKTLDAAQHTIASYLLGNIDDDGYLRRDLDEIVDDIAFSQNIITTKAELSVLLKTIQELDPPGVGARNLQECLLLQLERKTPKTNTTQLAIMLIRECMEEFSKKHYAKIAIKLAIDVEQLKLVIAEILKLNPKPGSVMAEGQKSFQQIIPDFTIYNADGILELTLNSKNAPELKVSTAYTTMLLAYANKKDKTNKDAALFVKQKLDNAKWFIDAIQQRQQTLLLTMNAIMKHQYTYFIEGDERKLRPMILKDLAATTGLDISTLSRVVNSKYVQTPFGTFLLKTFFSEASSKNTGEEVSTKEVKKILEECILGESKKNPFSDDKLAEILQEKGYIIARRTIAKYREQLAFPVARLRKEL